MPSAPAESLLAGVAETLTGQLDDLAVPMLAAIAQELPELVPDASLRAALDATVRENLLAALLLLRRPGDDTLPAPGDSLEHSRRLAQRGVPLASLLRAYRLGQAAFQQQVIHALAATHEGAEQIVGAALVLSGTTFSYIDRISEQVVTVYQRERDLSLHRRTAERSAQVDALLAADGSAVRDAEHALGYVLEQPHLAVVLWSEHPGATETLSVTLDQAAGRLAHDAGCTGAPLAVARDTGTAWVWLPHPARVPGSAPEDGLRAAIGTVARGLSGFRASHAEALDARRVATAAAPGKRLAVTHAEEVGPLALLCDDVPALARWVQRTLRALAADDEGSERLRRTLEVFLATGGSHVQTGRQLTLHRNSVAYRVTRAVELLGAPIEDRRLDLQLALLATRFLGEPVLQPAHR